MAGVYHRFYFFEQRFRQVIFRRVGQVCLAVKAGFSISIGLGIFGWSGSHAFCQLPKDKSCAIIFSSLWQGLAPVRGAGVRWVRLTKRALDAGESARF